MIFVQNRTLAVFRCKKFAKGGAEKYCSTFHLYVINIVLPWDNLAQKIHFATYIQTVQ